MKAWLGKVEGQKIRHGGSGKAGGQARHDQAIVRRPRRQIVGPGGGQAGL